MKQLKDIAEEKVLVPMTYWQSKGLPRGGKKTQTNSYKWRKSSVDEILSQHRYRGDIINFKTYSKYFKNKRRQENPPENWVIFKVVRESIIDRETFLQAQKMAEKTKCCALKNAKR